MLMKSTPPTPPIFFPGQGKNDSYQLLSTKFSYKNHTYYHIIFRWVFLSLWYSIFRAIYVLKTNWKSHAYFWIHQNVQESYFKCNFLLLRCININNSIVHLFLFSIQLCIPCTFCNTIFFFKLDNIWTPIKKIPWSRSICILFDETKINSYLKL